VILSSQAKEREACFSDFSLPCPKAAERLGDVAGKESIGGIFKNLPILKRVKKKCDGHQ